MPVYYHATTQRYVRTGAAFDLGGRQYPANWLERATPEDLTGAGLVECPVIGTPGDPRLYVITEQLVDGEVHIINTAKSYAEVLAVSLDLAKQVKDAADADAAKADTLLIDLMAKSPAQVRAWVDASVTSTPQIREALATVAVAVAVLARRL